MGAVKAGPGDCLLRRRPGLVETAARSQRRGQQAPADDLLEDLPRLDAAVAGVGERGRGLAGSSRQQAFLGKTAVQAHHQVAARGAVGGEGTRLEVAGDGVVPAAGGEGRVAHHFEGEDPFAGPAVSVGHRQHRRRDQGGGRAVTAHHQGLRAYQAGQEPALQLSRATLGLFDGVDDAQCAGRSSLLVAGDGEIEGGLPGGRPLALRLELAARALEEAARLDEVERVHLALAEDREVPGLAPGVAGEAAQRDGLALEFARLVSTAL